MCSRTSKHKSQSGRRLNTLVAFFEIFSKILERFQCQIFQKRSNFEALVAFWSTKIHVILCIDDSWSWNDDVFLLNSKSTFLNYSKLLKDLDSALTKPKSKSGIFIKNDRTMRTYVSLIIDMGKNVRNNLTPNTQNFLK